jgi:ribosomal protein L37AE/L43A
MAADKNNDRRCAVCGKPATVRGNGQWLCDECAMRATQASLEHGIPVLVAYKGEPKVLIMGRTIKSLLT